MQAWLAGKLGLSEGRLSMPLKRAHGVLQDCARRDGRSGFAIASADAWRARFSRHIVRG
jgi:hypothetical protein